MRTTSTGQKEMTNGDADYRYTLRVFLVRDSRPKYWEFHCAYCGTKVCELNGQVVYASDVTPDSASGASRIRCNGKFCRMWYEFSLG